MPAETLEKAIRLFDPKKTLTDEDLEKYYVERDSAVIRRLEVLLFSADDPKILFSGHMGSGKSTELNKFRKNIELKYPDLIIVMYDVAELLDTLDIDASDVLFTLTSELYRKAQEKNIPINKAVFDELSRFLSEITKEVEEIESNELSLKTKLELLFFGTETKYRSEEFTRTKIREQLKPRLGKLIELTNAIITQIKLAGSKVIIILDGLDHPPKVAATRIFNDYGDLLKRPDCPIIYTIPIEVVYSNEFNQICRCFDDRVILPNIAVIDKNGNPVNKNIELFKRAIERRMSLDLIETDALEHAIRMSGGVMRELIWIIRTSSVNAIVNNQKKITLPVVNKVINERINDFRRILTRIEQNTALLKIKEAKSINIIADEKVLDQIPFLLRNLSVLEYNDSIWWDVHPAVLPILIDPDHAK